MLIPALLAAAGCTKLLGLGYDYEPAGSGGQGMTASAASSSSSSSSSGAGGGPACGHFLWDASQPKCQGCMEKSCCAELLSCDTGTPCAEIASCDAQCAPTDVTCKGACIDADQTKHHGAGLTSWLAIFLCYSSNCTSTSNPFSCAYSICTSGLTSAYRDCASCLGKDPMCCQVLGDCTKDAVCNACLGNPTAMGCDANMLFAQALACETDTCGPVCEYRLCGDSSVAYQESSCNYCLSQSNGCCMEIDACKADPNSTCAKCFVGAQTNGCATDPQYMAFSNCYNQKCSVQCSGL